MISAMARLAEWTITEGSGRQHRVLVQRRPLLGVGVLVDTRRIDRFDRTPEADRHATNLAGHVLTVNTPRLAKHQPTLTSTATDSVLFIVVRDILGIAVHAIAIYWLSSGWRAARSLKRLETPTPALVG
jgi:hypothetical protein